MVNRVEFDQLTVSVFLKCQNYVENQEILRLRHALPMVDIGMIETTTVIIDGLLLKHKDDLKQKKEEDLKLALEGIFIYAAMWGFGGSFLENGEDAPFYKSFERL